MQGVSEIPDTIWILCTKIFTEFKSERGVEHFEEVTRRRGEQCRGVEKDHRFPGAHVEPSEKSDCSRCRK
ncbi:hypothetical protein CEXT_529071 [Caerostris extrusa]|uniref:Uncharacterized protein n=1 Tax=Caerostris extrusa TaxID=172846 RepID=A0AAV4PLG6_CAEEX|nr:hypothetical protein CEXT_529071 [Caerostris extrusa]